MNGQAFFQLLIIGFVAVLSIVGLIIYNRRRKLSFILFGVSFFFTVKTFNCKSERVKTGESERIGDFILDCARSNFGSLNLADYGNTILHVSANNTFEITGNLPLKNKKGHWEYRDDGDISFVKYRFDGESETRSMLASGIDIWTLSSNGFEKQDVVFKLTFVRK